MSLTNVEQFFKKVKSDSLLQERLQNDMTEAYDEFTENTVQLGNEAGYPFSKEDMQQVTQDAFTSVQHEGELDDDQLEDVSGGSLLIGLGIGALWGVIAVGAGVGIGLIIKFTHE